MNNCCVLQGQASSGKRDHECDPDLDLPDAAGGGLRVSESDNPSAESDDDASSPDIYLAKVITIFSSVAAPCFWHKCLCLAIQTRLESCMSMCTHY